MAYVMATGRRLGKVALAALAAALFCAASPPNPNASPDAAIAKTLTGRFDTMHQFNAADAALKVAPSVAGEWLDRQYAEMHRVSAPQIGETVIYLEWRSGGPQGPISRQRIWSFRGGPTPRMTFYTFVDPAPFAAKGATRDAFSALTPAQLRGYPEDCDVQWSQVGKGWRGRIDPAACRIVARSGRAMRLDVTIATDAESISYQEKGVLDDGKTAFAVPPTMPYHFDRVPR